MRIKVKIVLTFMGLSMILLTTICVFVYFYSKYQHREDFIIKLNNRAKTVAAILYKLDDKDYNILSKVDSATSNTLFAENIEIFNNNNQKFYTYYREKMDSITVNQNLLESIRIKQKITKQFGNRFLLGAYFKQKNNPIIVTVSAYDEKGTLNLKKLLHNLFFAFFVGIFISFFTGLYLSYILLKPLKQISKEVKNITANNLENRLIESPVNDEWNQLSVTFNDLLSRLQKAFEIQGHFISNASHELSTPLTSVGNQIDVSLRKERTIEDYQNVLHSIRNDIHHMTSLTQQLLQIATSSTGGIIHSDVIRVDEIIMDLPAYLKKYNSDYIVKIFFEEFPEDEDLCQVNGSHNLLFSAFINIAENACKYSPDHKVNVSLSFEANFIYINFVNTCESLNDYEIENLFQPFQRGSNATNIKGFGLGLSLVRRLILLHKGEIKASLNSPNELSILLKLPSLIEGLKHK